jgi:hypothetical protein
MENRLRIVALALFISACTDHHGADSARHSSHGETGRAAQSETVAALAPAEGASIKILTPAHGQVFTRDEIPLRFELIKGKHGEHVHAYVNGEMAGMFKSTNGTLTGIKPGNHTLEVRVVMADHNTELDATDKVQFIVK